MEFGGFLDLHEKVFYLCAKSRGLSARPRAEFFQKYIVLSHQQIDLAYHQLDPPIDYEIHIKKKNP
jgi:hypothetical protein